MKKIFEKYDLLFYLVLTLLCLLTMASTGGVSYRDTDSYMWANRMIDWIQSSSWAEKPFMHSNYPNGEILHWTRPLDVLWYGFYSFFKDMYPLKEAVFVSGIFLSPFIGFLSVIALYFMIKPFYSGVYRLLFMGAFFFPFPFQAAFGFYNPDHHALIFLFVLISFAFFMRWVHLNQLKAVIGCGIFSALSVWVSVESWIFFFMLLSAFLIDFCFFKRGLKPVFLFVKSYFISLGIALLINPPYQGFLYPDLGRLSILFVAMAGILLLNLKIMKLYRIEQCPIMQRVMALVPMGILSLVWLIYLFCPLFTSKLAEVWMFRIFEMRSPLESVSTTLYYLATPFLSLCLLCDCIYKQKKFQLWQASLLIFLGGYFVLGCHSFRFFVFLSLFSIIPFIDWLYLETKDLKKEEVVPNHVMMIAFLFFIGAAVGVSCRDIVLNNSISQPLNQNNFLLSKNGRTVLSDVFMGPKIIFETGRNVIATPYHRNEEGILDSHAIFYGTDMDKVYALLQKHDVEDIILTVPKKDVYYQNAPEMSFYKRILSQKEMPFWFELIEFKEEKQGYRILGKFNNLSK